jgi:hypothetical protein
LIGWDNNPDRKPILSGLYILSVSPDFQAIGFVHQSFCHRPVTA